MNKLILLKLILLFNILLYGCGKQSNINTSEFKKKDPLNLYTLAMQDLDNLNYEDAIISFNELIYSYPLSNESIQSKIMLAFIDYINMQYEDAIFKLDKIIRIYPSHKNMDYVFYMKAMCFFERIEDASLDGLNNLEALKGFEELINRFPDSEYARDGSQKIIFINENIAAKHMRIGMYYLEHKKYNAALNRFNKVIKNYSESKFTPEALHRLVEIYSILGIISDAEKTASVLAYNYPKSKWYENSFNLLFEQEKNKNKFNLHKKLSDIFSKK